MQNLELAKYYAKAAVNRMEGVTVNADTWRHKYENIIIFEIRRALDAVAERERGLRIALADAIRRPMGVIPKSAEGLLTPNDLDEAEERRVYTTISKELA